MIAQGCSLVCLLALGADSPVPNSPPPFVLPDARFGARTAPLLLLSRSDVRKDLKLSDQQTASALAALAKLRSDALAIKDAAPTDQVVAARRAIDEAQYRWIEEGLDEGQRSRLRQLDWQWEGPSVLLTRPLITERMAIGPDQAKAIVTSLRAVPYDRAHAGQSVEAIVALLDEEQKAKWETIWGRPFPFAKVKDARGPGR